MTNNKALDLELNYDSSAKFLPNEGTVFTVFKFC